MVIPLLAAAGAIGLKFLPRILPIIGKGIKIIAAKPLTRFFLPSILIGSAIESPAIRKALKKAPTAPFEAGKLLGKEFETRIEKERPTGKARRALEIGGIAGIAAAAGVLGTRELRRRRRRRKEVAAAIPAIPPTELVPSPAGALPTGALPAAIEAPTAIKELPTDVKVPKAPRKPRKRQALEPVFINQIQITN